MRSAIPLLLLVACLTASEKVLAEDCTTRPTQTEQIQCLQKSIDELSRQIETLRSSPAQKFSSSGTSNLDQLIEDKIRQALQPRIQPLR